jgi:starch phosphorylase
MKVVLNGGLNCSILDGWWAELYDSDVGWSVPTQGWIDDLDARDATEAAALMTILEDDVVPAYYDRDDSGMPREWMRKSKTSLARLGPQLSATRMLREYVDDWYVPARNGAHAVATDGFRRARELVGWHERIDAHWPGVAVRNVRHEEHVTAATTHRVVADVDLGGLAADEVEVSLWCGVVGPDDELVDPVRIVMQPEPSPADGALRCYVAHLANEEPGDYGIAVELTPRFPSAPELVTGPRPAWAPPNVLPLG